MNIYKKKEVDVIDDILCDICHKSCKTVMDIFEYSVLAASWGYGSRKDGDKFNEHYCEDCSNKIIKFIKSLRGEV